MVPRRTNLLSPDESALLRFLLAVKNRPREVKAGLQRLCAHYEAGRTLSDPHEHRLLVRALLWNQETVVRRWAYKALAWIGLAENIDELLARVRGESDFENQTWAMAAIIKLGGHLTVREVCESAGLEFTLPLQLAARLFATKSWIETNSNQVLISVDESDALTLKWAALLAGYDRAPANLFDPAHENVVLLGKLNDHPEAEVSEYSVWALWQSSRYELAHLGFSVDTIDRRPENVRRWTNRLLTKSPTSLESDIDLFIQLRRDTAVVAREGLALGLPGKQLSALQRPILDWYSDEPEDSIRDLLLEHMAYASDPTADYADLVEQSYRQAGRGAGLRRKLLAASTGTALYRALRRIEIMDEVTDAGLPFHTTSVLIQTHEVNMNNTNFNAGRDINAQNMVGGNMIASANSAVQKMGGGRAAEQKVLSDLVKFLQQEHPWPEPARSDAIKAIEVVANDPKPEAKTDLIEKLTKVAGGAGAIAGAADQIGKFIDVVSQFLS